MERSSGILLHITSLPSPFGIGDFGPEAYEFVDFLQASGYRYWQLLPLNPTEGFYNHSPYSSDSAFAGNILLISPELLEREGFIELQNFQLPSPENPHKIDFEEVSVFKTQILDAAFLNHRKKKTILQGYTAFCKAHEFWLDDYCLYKALKEKFNSSWVSWPEELRDRNPVALKKAKKDLAENILKFKFHQYLFFKQWNNLTRYGHLSQVEFIGDIPFYVSLDSADCWKNPEYFKLDKKMKPQKVSGVPPDYFSKTGQLWGTPVYNWKILKNKKYDWWIERLKQNLLLFDLVRLDHFRAFSAYWEVPAGDKTAVNGKWVKTPGRDFFKNVMKRFPALPFIAEDLGELDEGVYKLMDEFGFPGMKVLQFAFGDDRVKNTYLPFNHLPNNIVYTGTHDNNTTKGWFKKAEDIVKSHLKEYAMTRVTSGNVHEVMHKIALNSVAGIAIIPLQDIVGLGSEALMNVPGSTKGNWTWRLKYEELPLQRTVELKSLNKVYGRCPPPKRA